MPFDLDVLDDWIGFQFVNKGLAGRVHPCGYLMIKSGSVNPASGLGDLIGRLTAGGVGPQVNSWVGPGANQPVQPGQLGGALGQNTLNELSQRTGMSQQELLNQLAVVLPQLINNLTPKGRVPTAAELEQ